MLDLKSFEQIKQLRRPTEVPDQGVMADLLWSELSDGKHDVFACQGILIVAILFLEKGWQDSFKGISYTFGDDVIETFCNEFSIDLIIRSSTHVSCFC